MTRVEHSSVKHDWETPDHILELISFNANFGPLGITC